MPCYFGDLQRDPTLENSPHSLRFRGVPVTLSTGCAMELGAWGVLIQQGSFQFVLGWPGWLGSILGRELRPLSVSLCVLCVSVSVSVCVCVCFCFFVHVPTLKTGNCENIECTVGYTMAAVLKSRSVLL